jgi:hypothetical protein
MGKSTISMAIFNSYFDITRRYVSRTTLWTTNKVGPTMKCKRDNPEPKLQWLSWKYTLWLFNIAMDNCPCIDDL